MGERALLAFQRVRVLGPSMSPTLRHGDAVLVRHRARIRPGDVVLARFPAMPDRLVIKRAAYAVDGGWWVTSDNPFADGDSERHGVAEVQARAVFRLWPGPPRRLRRQPP